MGTPSNLYSWWQFSRWVYNISRNYKITEPIDTSVMPPGDLTFIRTFLWVIGDPNNPVATRPWLGPKFQRCSEAAAEGYDFDLAKEPTHVLVELLGVVGRDFKKIPLTDFEGWGCIILFNVTDYRALGTGPYFGSVGGSVVSIP